MTRQRDVDKTTRGDVRIVVCFRFVFPRFVEGCLHALFAIFRTRVKGSGGTEYFWLPYFFTALILSLVWVLSLCLSIAVAFLGVMLFYYDGNAEGGLNQIIQLLK